jgi:hypothetical protein
MDNPPPSSTHPGEGSLHSENLMSLSEEERNPRHYKYTDRMGKNKRLSLRAEQILRNYQNILQVSDFDVTYWCGAGHGPPIVISVERLRLIESNAKCHLKKFTCKGTLRQVSEAPSPPRFLFGVILQFCRF